MTIQTERIRHLITFITNLLLLVAVGLAMLLFIPRLCGMDTYAILSSSMEPTLPVGGLIYTSPCGSLSELGEQDIIAYRTGEVLVTHRAVSIDREAGTITTQGDANKVPDEAPVYIGDVIGRVRYCIPGLGYFLIALQGKRGKFFIILSAAALLALCLLRPGQAKEKGTASADQADTQT